MADHVSVRKGLASMQIYHKELKTVKTHEYRTYYENLDKIEESRKTSYDSALDQADLRHEAIRQGARDYLNTHLAKQKKAKEREALRKEERRRRQEEQLKKEKERQEKQQKQQQEEEEQQKQRQKQEEEEQRKQAAEAARKAADAAGKEQIIQQKQAEEKQKKGKETEYEKTAPAPAPAPPAAAAAAFGAVCRSQEEISNHERYLEIHKNLKELRKWMESQARAIPNLKTLMGENRRTIKKCTGQLVPDDKKANKTPTQEVAKILKNSLSVTQPSVDIRQFLAFPTPEVGNAPTTQVPALFIYLLNMLSKSVIAQLIAESGVKPRSAESIGIFVAQILSQPDLCFHGTSMIDILLAKYHVVCPVLFGFYGPESTAQGKEAMGWWREDGRPSKNSSSSSSSDGNSNPFVAAQVHEERMIGLASGFAAMSLRNFSKAKRSNPLPNRYFWAAVAYILEVPPEEVQDTQLYVLAALLRHSAGRVIGFWGDYGVGLLRYATVDFLGAITAAMEANRSRHSPAKAAAELLRLSWANDKGIFVV